MRAAFDGSKEIAFTILSMTLSLAAVFIPVLFMGGVVGRLLHEFAVTIGVAILVSGFVSISLTPMLCSRFLKPPHAQKHGAFYNATERMFDAWLRALRLDAARQPALPRGRRWRSRSRCSSAPSTCSRQVPKGFLPSEDQGRFNISTEADAGHRLRRDGPPPAARSPRSSPRIRTSPRSATTSAAARAAAALNTGQIAVDLKPRAERKRSGRSGHRGAAAEAGAGARRARLHGQPAADQPRRPAGPRAASISSRCRTPTPTSSTAGRRSSRTSCASCPASRTSAATCRSRTRRSASTWIATRSRRSA